MTALPPAPQCMRVRLKGQALAVNMGNRFYINFLGSATSQTDMNTLAADIQGGWATNLQSYISNTYLLTEVDVEDLTSSTGLVGTWTGSVAGGDTATGGDAPASMCAVVSCRVSRHYRGGHSRQYLGPVKQTHLSSANRFNDTWATNLGNAYKAFAQYINGLSIGALGQLTCGSVSYYSGYDKATRKSALRTNPQFNAWQSWAVNDRPGSQRRRLGKLGVYDG